MRPLVEPALMGIARLSAIQKSIAARYCSAGQVQDALPGNVDIQRIFSVTVLQNARCVASSPTRSGTKSKLVKL